MANPYSSQSAVNYNVSPPPDDGTKVAANSVIWATIKTKLADPVLNLANAINTAVQSAFGTLFLNTVSPQSANYNVAASDRGKILTISNGASVTLLAPASAGTGWAVTVKNAGTLNVSILPNGAENIDGTNASVVLIPGDSFTLVSDGTAWWIAGGQTFIRRGAAGGTADALTMTNKPPIGGLIDGQLIFLRAAAANATATPTFAPDGLAAQTITKLGGVALVAGDIAASGHELILRYRLSPARWELLNPAVTVTDATNGGISVTASTPPTLGLKPSDLLTKATPTTSDSIVIMDAAASNAAKTATLPAVVGALFSPITNSLSGDVALNNTANFFDGPSVAQGTVGTWYVSGTVTVIDTTGASNFFVKLWDGTTIIASAEDTIASASQPAAISLSAVITNPAGNLRISVRDATNTTGFIKFNVSGLSLDSTITAIRLK